MWGVAEKSYLSGVVWSGLNAAAGVVLPLLIFIFFARALPPAQVGVVALAVAWSEIIKGLGLPGLYEALLQQAPQDARHHETAIALLLVAGVALFLLYLAVIAVAAPWRHDASVGFVLLGAIGLRIPFDLATLQPQARLAQSLAYRRLAMRSVYANLAAGAVGVVLSFLGEPLLGLVVYQVGQLALVFFATVLGTGALARPRFHRDCARAMAREAGFASANRFIAGAINYLDQVAVGAVLDPRRLAYFNLAKRAEMSLVTAAVSFNSILFQPLFARRGEGALRRADGISRGLAVLALACGLPTAVFAVNSETVVAAVFGQQWAEAAPVATALSLSGFARALGFAHIGLMSVSGRNHLILASTAVSALSGALLVVACAPLGLVWCAAAIAAKNALVTAWMAFATRADAPGSLRIYAAQVITPFALMLAGAGLGRWASEGALAGSAGFLPTLAVWTASGGLAAIFGLLCLGRQFPQAMLSLRRPQAIPGRN